MAELSPADIATILAAGINEEDSESSKTPSISSLRSGSDVQPLWWGQFEQQLDLILNQRKQATKQFQDLLRRMNIVENHDRGEKDSDLPFHIIKFCSPEHAGVDPTTLGLPRILNVQSLRSMDEQAVDAYCKGYSICVAPESDYDQRKEQILRYIGHSTTTALRSSHGSVS
ncbi:hypothetical protein C8J56DRAFT_940593 [Mycena floridula]|nr:hypothetical protein C8J56DRAFT_940593 [Mycena floridula]